MSGESVVRRVLNQETSRRSRTREKGAVCFEFTDTDDESHRVRIANGVDPSEAVSVSEPDAREYGDALPELPLPGSGERLEECGEEIPALFCRGCGSPHSVGRTCRRSRCPRCWQSWAFQRAKSIAAKIQSLALQEVTQEGRTKIKQHHLTVSLRDSTRFNSKDPIGRGIEAVKLLLSQVNVETGYIILHPYRIAEEYRGEVLGHESGSGCLTWKDVLEKVEDESWSWEAVRDEYLIYSPHFHVICLSEFVQGGAVSRRIEEESGVVIERITTKREDGKVRSIADLEELCRVTAYSLSHAALAPESEGETHRVVARPFGRVANFEAWDGVKGEVKETLREVAPKVLGIQFPDPSCSERHPDVVGDHDHDECDHGHDPAPTSNARRLVTSGPSGVSRSFSQPATSPTAETWEAATDAFEKEREAGSWSSGSPVRADVSDSSGRETSPCGGQLVPMWAADAYLGDLEWLNGIEERYGEDRLIDLRAKLTEWERLGRPRPDVPPDD